MTVEKVESTEFVQVDGENFIKIELRDLFKPYLLGTSYCDYITIWWNCHADNYAPSVKVYAITRVDDGEDIVSKAEEWYDFELMEAMRYTMEELS